jgi:ATP-dependent Lon protease
MASVVSVSFDPVGVGYSLGVLGHGRFEVECASLALGTGILRTTGHLKGAALEAVKLARAWVAGNHDRIYERLEKEHIPGATWRAFFHRTRDLHVHIDQAWPAEDSPSYVSTFVVAMVSWVLGREPPPDMAVIGGVDFDGQLLEPAGFGADHVRACVEQGIRRLIISSAFTPDDMAREAADVPAPDGEPALTFYTASHMTQVLNFLLPGPAHAHLTQGRHGNDILAV